MSLLPTTAAPVHFASGAAPAAANADLAPVLSQHVEATFVIQTTFASATGQTVRLTDTAAFTAFTARAASVHLLSAQATALPTSLTAPGNVFMAFFRSGDTDPTTATILQSSVRTFGAFTTATVTPFHIALPPNAPFGRELLRFSNTQGAALTWSGLPPPALRILLGGGGAPVAMVVVSEWTVRVEFPALLVLPA
jgi:hypothetical protein